MDERVPPTRRRGLEAEQQVLDAAMALLWVRQDVLSKGAEVIVASGEEANTWIMREARLCRELLSTRCVTTVANLQMSMPNNRRVLDGGTKMLSLFDRGGTEPAARQFLRNEARPDVYFLTIAPVHMKVIDRERVLMSGNLGVKSIMEIRTPRAVEAAMHYWNACWRFAEGCDSTRADSADSARRLTSRQQLIIELLCRGDTDEVVARTIHLSRRTVQLEVAAAMTTLNVGSRCALGYAYSRYQGAADPQTDQPPM